MFDSHDLANGIRARAEAIIPPTDLESLRVFAKEMSEYLNYCATIHEYQATNKISGLEQLTVEIGDRSISFHAPIILLNVLKDDRRVLWREKQQLVDFFLLEHSNVFCGFDPTIYLPADDGYKPTSADELKAFAAKCSFGCLSYNEVKRLDTATKKPRLYSELILFLGKGNPDTTPLRGGNQRFRAYHRFGEIDHEAICGKR